MQLRHLFPLVPAFAALMYACDDHGPTVEVGDVILEGTVTDEAYGALDVALGSGAPKDDPMRKATLDMPADGASLPRATPPVFTWHFGTAGTERAPLPDFGPTQMFAQQNTVDWSAPLRMLLAPVRTAHAHGDPFNGTGTFLVFSTDSEPNLVRVFTSNTSYVPSADAWGKMTSAGKPITLKLVSAIFESNRVAQDGGPFEGSTTTFTVAP
ncbi:MAG: hypothetical protein IPM54_25675 [Polyangiaceae bacterium]|nr:hypothetical protein [Polyangiaceae bacterium]